jgi:hypothetical protein
VTETVVNQRWRARRDSYRPAGEVIDTARYEVAAIADDTTPKRFVLEHHYSVTYPAARFRYGLYERGGQLVGVAVFSHPTNDRTLTSVFKGTAPTDAVELGRFVLLNSVAGNGESWFLGQCFAELRRHVVGVVSFADPVPRATDAGAVVFPGHVGTIYQAFNGVYLGRATARTLRLLPDGRVLSARAIQKIRAMEQGWRHSSAVLEQLGAAPLTGDPAAWLRTWLPRVTRALRHAGNHRYAWPLDRAMRRILPASLAYPKQQQEIRP